MVERKSQRPEIHFDPEVDEVGRSVDIPAADEFPSRSGRLASTENDPLGLPDQRKRARKGLGRS